MLHKNRIRPEAEQKKGNQAQLAAAMIVILVLVLAVSGIAKSCVAYIRTNVRNTTIQVISELTGSKFLILSSILEETAR